MQGGGTGHGRCAGGHQVVDQKNRPLHRRLRRERSGQVHQAGSAIQPRLIWLDATPPERLDDRKPQPRGNAPGQHLGMVEAPSSSVDSPRWDPRHGGGLESSQPAGPSHPADQRLGRGTSGAQFECKDQRPGCSGIGPGRRGEGNSLDGSRARRRRRRVLAGAAEPSRTRTAPRTSGGTQHDQMRSERHAGRLVTACDISRGGK